MIQIIGSGLRYGGAPLDVGQTRRFDAATEAAMVATGNAIYVGQSDMGPIVTLFQSHTQSVCPANTNENNLAALMVPGGLMGPNDSIRVRAQFSCSNNANTKTARFRFGGTSLSSSSVTTVGGLVIASVISNRNSPYAQVAGPAATTSNSSPTFGAVDTTAPWMLAVTGQLGVSTDTLALESVLVELLRGAAYR